MILAQQNDLIQSTVVRVLLCVSVTVLRVLYTTKIGEWGWEGGGEGGGGEREGAWMLRCVHACFFLICRLYSVPCTWYHIIPMCDWY